ncbi:MAG: hypothetical protein WBI40_10875 [Methylococcaceae bacterium]
MANPATVTPLKRVDKPNDTESVMLSIFDMHESQFESMLERRVNNRLTFLSIVKSALTEGIDYCNLPVKGKKALPTLLKGGGEVVCQILGLTPQIEIAESSDQAIIIRCQLHNEHQKQVSVGFGARTYALDANQGGRNKTIKMATKSAYLDSVIRAGALSSLFTLDLEDTSDNSSKTVELISPSQVQHLTKIVNEYQLDMKRFMTWLSKFSQNHKGSAITELNQLPLSLFNSVIQKIPTLATSAK